MLFCTLAPKSCTFPGNDMLFCTFVHVLQATTSVFFTLTPKSCTFLGSDMHFMHVDTQVVHVSSQRHGFGTLTCQVVHVSRQRHQFFARWHPSPARFQVTTSVFCTLAPKSCTFPGNDIRFFPVGTHVLPASSQRHGFLHIACQVL